MVSRWQESRDKADVLRDAMIAVAEPLTPGDAVADRVPR